MHNNEVNIFMRDGYKVIEVDMKKTKYFSIPWVDLSEWQKRKYENFLYLSNQERSKIKFIYQ
jgi:hypothetical protein